MGYKKDSPRINVKFYDEKTEELLFEINDRSWMDIGEILSDYHFNNVIEKEILHQNINPDKILVVIATEFNKIK